MSRRFLREAAPGDLLEDVFIICDKQLAPTSTGKQFIKALLGDRSGQMNARMWNASRELFDTIPDSGYLRVRGRVENYQGHLQCIIEALWPAREGEFAADELMPHTKRDIGQMSTELIELAGSIQNRHVAAIVQAYLDDTELMEKFRKAPAAKSMHHAFIGGLLEHTLSAMQVADAVVKFYPLLSRDIVLAGVFVHDIAKTYELSYECSFGYTDGGNLVGHIVKGAIWVEQYSRAAEKMLNERIPQRLIEVLQHIVISHHGEPQFGAIKRPGTPEALLVHVIENLDAKMMMMLACTRGDAKPIAGRWTEYQKAFDGRLYCPDVAPADAGEGEPLEVAEPPAVAAPTLKLQITNPLFEAPQARKY